MNKFKKRLAKSATIGGDALVIGTAFGHLEDILDFYTTVFVWDNVIPDIKARNFVFKKDFVLVLPLKTISVIFMDLKHKDKFDSLVPVMASQKPILVFEGEDILPKSQTTTLASHGFNAVSRHGYFHVWKKVR